MFTNDWCIKASPLYLVFLFKSATIFDMVVHCQYIVFIIVLGTIVIMTIKVLCPHCSYVLNKLYFRMKLGQTSLD